MSTGPAGVPAAPGVRAAVARSSAIWSACHGLDRVGRFAFVGDGAGVLGQLLGGHGLAGLGGAGEDCFRCVAGGVAALAELVEKGHCWAAFRFGWPPHR